MTPRPTLVHVPPHRCRMPDPDQRDRSDPAYVEYRDNRLRPDVRARGVQQPLLAVAGPGDCFRVVDGGTRLEVALLEGLADIPVLVLPEAPAPGDIELARHMANEMRRDFTPAERARFYLTVMAERGWSQGDLCRALHLSPARVSKTLRVFDRLPSGLHARVGDGPGMLPFRAAYALTAVADPAAAADLADRVQAGRLTVEALEDEVGRLKGKAPRHARPVTVRLPGGAVLVLPAASTWEAVQTLGRQLADAAARGVRHNLPPRHLPELLRGG